MDLDELRSILRKSRVDVWTLIDTAISVASSDNRDELKQRRDGIVEKLYVSSVLSNESLRISNEIKEKDNNSIDGKNSSPLSIDGDDFQDQIFDGSNDEQTKILMIKECLEEPNQTEDSLVNLLQELADMEITFQALKETDIGRHVNQFRKNPSSQVRGLVKELVRKWKYLVDEWVSSNQPRQTATSSLIDGDSPIQNQSKHNQNGHHIPDFAFSPNRNNGSSGSDKYNSEAEPKMKVAPTRRDIPPKSSPTVPSSSLAPNKKKDNQIDPERLASARKRLHENYQEAQNARKERKIQVMEIHELPKQKNSYFPKNKGNFQSKHW